MVLLAALVAVGEPARASAPDPAARSGPVLLVPTPGVGEKTAKSSPTLFAAIQRDLRLTRGEAITRLGRQHAAGAVEARARRAAGRHLAGSWLSDDGSAVMVAVTDQRAAAAVRTAGATPTLVTYGRGELEAAGLKLRARADKLPGAAVHAWHVDPARNRLVVAAASGQESAAAEWVADAGVPAALVAYDRSERPPTPAADVLGGEAFMNPRGQTCTVGFGVRPRAGSDGFVTAGHCAFNSDQIRIGGLEVGFTSQSSFPPPTSRTLDRAFVRLDVNNQPLPLVKTNDFGGAISVLGSQGARPGDMLCSYGETSKWRCGTLKRRNLNVLIDFSTATRGVVGQVTVLGLNEASFCSSPGDSGGPVITSDGFSGQGGQAQGTVVATLCKPPPLASATITYYQPINQTLNDFQLQLLVDRGIPFPLVPPPTVSAVNCSEGRDYYFYCDIHWQGGTDPDEIFISSNGTFVREVLDPDGNYAYFSGKCVTTQDTYVSVIVTDAEGRRATARQSGFCD
jgi:streptogrisin C